MIAELGRGGAIETGAVGTRIHDLIQFLRQGQLRNLGNRIGQRYEHEYRQHPDRRGAADHHGVLIVTSKVERLELVLVAVRFKVPEPVAFSQRPLPPITVIFV